MIIRNRLILLGRLLLPHRMLLLGNTVSRHVATYRHVKKKHKPSSPFYPFGLQGVNTCRRGGIIPVFVVFLLFEVSPVTTSRYERVNKRRRGGIIPVFVVLSVAGAGNHVELRRVNTCRRGGIHLCCSGCGDKPSYTTFCQSGGPNSVFGSRYQTRPYCLVRGQLQTRPCCLVGSKPYTRRICLVWNRWSHAIPNPLPRSHVCGLKPLL